MMQAKKIILLSLTIGLMSCGSDYLSPAPISATTTEFTDEVQLEGAAVNMYDGIQGVNSTSANDSHGIQYEFYLTEMRSDNTQTKASEGEAAQFENYSIEATNGIVLDYYRSYYNIIYRANVVLENLNVASEEKAKKYEGEAKFVRAYAYFNLVRLFGDVPLVDKPINPSDDAAFIRVESAKVYDLIVSDLTTAVANLDNTYKTRASQAAAQSLLAKVYLTRGDYANAKTMCEAVIGSGFSLEDNFVDVFYQELNDEIIFAIGYLPDVSDDSQGFSAEWLNAVGRTSGVNYATPDVKTILDASGGNRTQYSYREDQSQALKYQVVKYLPDGDDGLGIAATSTDPTKAGNDWIILRYADVLLMYVEAVMAGGDSTSDAIALTHFNAVRTRAGLATVTNITKQNLLDERRVELAFENQRWFDLVRFGEAPDVLSAFSTANGFSYSASDLLLPIPQAEIGISGKLLTQNPGY